MCQLRMFRLNNYRPINGSHRNWTISIHQIPKHGIKWVDGRLCTLFSTKFFFKCPAALLCERHILQKRRTGFLDDWRRRGSNANLDGPRGLDSLCQGNECNVFSTWASLLRKKQTNQVKTQFNEGCVGTTNGFFFHFSEIYPSKVCTICHRNKHWPIYRFSSKVWIRSIHSTITQNGLHSADRIPARWLPGCVKNIQI